LYYLKNYPRLRVLRLIFGLRSLRNLQRSLWRRIRALAASLEAVLDAGWQLRRTYDNPVSDIFGNDCTGAIDTFPVRCQRPKDPVMQRFLYNGKYGCHVAKVQMTVTHWGRPIFVSGPHLGVRSDIRLFREAGPDLDDAEELLADKAYVSAPGCIVPFKRRRARRLTRAEKDYNLVHRCVCLLLRGLPGFAARGRWSA
jgi:hypothetical protein